jgi:hypothetical protein
MYDLILSGDPNFLAIVRLSFIVTASATLFVDWGCPPRGRALSRPIRSKAATVLPQRCAHAIRHGIQASTGS